MSLAVKATHSAAWLLAGSVLSRAVGLIGTLIVIRFVSPTDYGEAIAGAIVVGTASQFSSLGIGQFVIVKAGENRNLAFHATVFQLFLGLLATAILLLVPDQLSAYLNAPGMSRYMPALVLSLLIDRVSFVPERTLMRELRFRSVTLARTAGELTYTGVALALAIAGWGGMTIAVANVARSLARAAIVVPQVDRRDWLEPCRLRLDAALAILRFGAPLSIGGLASFITGKWDNLLVSSFFGPAVMAEYNLAYNLAGTAPGLVSEQIIDILVPSLTKVEARKRPDALVRMVALLTLIAMPLCFGLAAVAPSVVSTMFDARWAGVSPMLAALSAVTVLAPTFALALAYLQVSDRPTSVMVPQVLAAIGIIGAISSFGRLGPVWTCGAVGIGTGLGFLAALFATRAVDRMPLGRLLSTHLGPFLACVPMVGMILVTRWLMTRGGMHLRGVNLVVEIVTGAITYAGGASLVARPACHDLIGLLRAAFLKRRGRLALESS